MVELSWIWLVSLEKRLQKDALSATEDTVRRQLFMSEKGDTPLADTEPRAPQSWTSPPPELDLLLSQSVCGIFIKAVIVD